MLTQVAKTVENQKLAAAALELRMFQMPGIRMRDENGIQTHLQRRIDVAARAIPDHPAVGLDDFELLDHSLVYRGIFFQHDFNRIEMRLQPRALDFRGLLWLVLPC